jgi:hypothetical protein
MKTDLLDAAGILERFGLSKAGLRKMRDSIGAPDPIFIDSPKFGLKPGVAYYRVSEFEDLEKRGVLAEFIK